MKIDWGEVRHRALRVHARLVGAWSLPEPLTERELAEAERQFGVVMPDGYRDFLLQVAAGGSGPVNLRRLVRGPGGWAWQHDRETNLAALASPFPDQDSYELLWDRAEAGKPSESATEDAWAAWVADCDELERAQTDGAVYLEDGGCGFHTLLIMSGSERGNVWFDRRATSDVIVPLRNADGAHASFTAFYLDWLHAAEQTLASSPAPVRRGDIRAPIYEARFDD